MYLHDYSWNTKKHHLAVTKTPTIAGGIVSRNYEALSFVRVGDINLGILKGVGYSDLNGRQCSLCK